MAADESFDTGALFVSESLKEIISSKGSAVLGVVGGRSVSGLFSRLSVDWNNIDVFLLDERIVPLDDEQSNYLQIKKQLPHANIHPLKEPEEYTELLTRKGGLDLVILSSGEDCHVASLFPDHPSINDDSEGFILVKNSPKPPASRISASRKLIETAERGLLLFVGESKKEAYNRFNRECNITSCPANIIKNIPFHLILTKFRD